MRIGSHVAHGYLWQDPHCHAEMLREVSRKIQSTLDQQINLADITASQAKASSASENKDTSGVTPEQISQPFSAYFEHKHNPYSDGSQTAPFMHTALLG